jgi:hypothetical protein
VGTSAAPDADPDRPVLLWGEAPDGGRQTWWVRATADDPGFEVDRRPGVVVATRRALYRWHTREMPLETRLDCTDRHGEAVGPGGDGRGVVAELQPLAGAERSAARRVLGPRREAAAESADWREEVELLGSLGPRLFLRRSAYGYHCGAHGRVDAEFLVYGMRAQRSLRPAPAPELNRAARRRIAGALRARARGLGFGRGVERTLYRPRFGPKGVEGVHQWTGPSCYACSDGRWDSYTVSTQLAGDPVPAAWKPHTPGIAEAVRWLTARRNGVVIRGASRPDPSLRNAFVAL